MKNFLKVFIFLLVSKSLLAQNLIPNYSFETYTTCPSSCCQVSYAFPWIDPTNASSDYFNTCASGLYSVPSNEGGFQTPVDGNAYAGIAMYVHTPSDTTQYNFREYIQVKLTDTLFADSCYELSFYVSLSNSYGYYKIGNMGAYFSANSISGPPTAVLNYIPQINYYDSAGIGDSVSWYKVEGIFKAVGNEQYITIGNFKYDSGTTAFVYNTSALNTLAYYYIDSVSLIQVTCPVNIGIEEKEDRFNISVYPNPAKHSITVDLSKFSDYSLIVTNTFGAIMLQDNFTGTSAKIFTDRWLSGIYCLKIVNKKSGLTAHKKLMVVH
jgi:hypothetical protein